MKNHFLNRVILGDALMFLPQLKNNSIDLVLTDPPYFLDKLDNKWNPQVVSKKNTERQTIQSLPPGMKFDKTQGLRLYEWFLKVSQELFRILKPGGFFFSFSSPRLYHRLACAVEDAGFLIRDCFIWLYTQNQPKAMSLNHFLDRLKISNEKIVQIKQKLNGLKTPQIKSCFEPIIMAQKPTEGTFLKNVLKHKTGLINTNFRIGKHSNMFPANVISASYINETADKYFLVAKPDKDEKGSLNTHKTVKPLSICEYIIKLTTLTKAAVVLDPFIGSGTTAVAAKKLGRKFIGVEINPEYIEIALQRLRQIEEDSTEETRAKRFQLKQLFYATEVKTLKKMFNQ